MKSYWNFIDELDTTDLENHHFLPQAHCLEVFFFLMWTIFLKSILNFYTIASVLSFVFFWPQGMWDLSSPTRDQIGNAKAGRQSPNHWTTREVPAWRFADSLSYLILTTTAR